jgi:ferric-dicitrate binding protein FerR (iron transport regulator)
MLIFPKQIDYHFLVRVQKDEVSPEEIEYFESWLAESEKNREIFGEITLLWDKIGTTQLIIPPDANKQWKNIVDLVKESKTDSPQKTDEVQTKVIQLKNFEESFRNKIRKSTVLKVAAIIGVIAISSLLIFSVKQPFKENTKIISEQIKTYEAIARKGEKIELRLSDGSKILVNSDSKLIYPSQFDEKLREVELIGEAYFSITENPNRPFKVICGNTVTIVRGTEFNIRNRKNTIKVVVARGLVDTYTPNSNIAINLKKGDMVFYNLNTGKSEQRKADLIKDLAWKNGKMIFEKTSLADVMEEVERCFNVDVYLATSDLQRKTLTGVFETNSIERILSVISLTLDIQISQSGRKILIKNNGS